MFNIGPLELVVVLIIALIVLGPQRLPDAARSVGRGIREFRGALNMDGDEDDWEAPEPPKEPAVEGQKPAAQGQKPALEGPKPAAAAEHPAAAGDAHAAAPPEPAPAEPPKPASS